MKKIFLFSGKELIIVLNLFSVVLLILSAALAVFFALLFRQPASTARQKQMDLIVTFLFASAAVFFLLDGLAASRTLSTAIWPVFGGWWLILLAVLMLGGRVRLSESFVQSASRWLEPLFFWIPEEKTAPESELERILEPGSTSESSDQMEVIENALDLGETTLDEICTHRSEMVSLSMKDDPARWKQVILANRHTFYPVTNESDDDVIGILDTRDYFRLEGFGKKNIMEKCVDKPLFAAENTTADELLHMMKNRRTYLAVVLDEYGGVVGLITLHDIIEELFGELSEEEEKRQADIVRLPRGVWRISGEADLKDVSKALGIPLHLDDFETFSGYVLGSIGYIPDDGSQLEVTAGPLLVQIKRIAGHRIRQTLVRLKPDASAETPLPSDEQKHPAEPLR